MIRPTASLPVALVSGANGSIGRAVSGGLLTSGYRVVLLGSQEAPTELELLGHQAIYVKRGGDTDSWARNAANAAIESFGRIDALIACAGGIASSGDWTNLTLEDWHSAYQDNVVDVAILMRSVVPYFSNEGGSIVCVSSFVAHNPGVFNPHYSAAKAALNHLVKYMARTLAPRRITVNSVSPAYTLTAGLLRSLELQSEMAGLDSKLYVEERLRGMAEKSPLARLLSPEEIAEIIVFLTTSSRTISGQDVLVDAGMTLQR